MDKSNEAWKKFFIFLSVGLIPLVVIFFTYQIPSSDIFFNFLFGITKNASVNISSNNVLLSHTLGIYCRIAIPLSLLFVFLYGKNIKLAKTDVPFSHYVIRLLVFSALCFTYVYAMTFYHLDITNGNRFLKFVSSNDYLLLSYYLVGFSGIYLFLTLLLLLIIKLPEAYRNTSTTKGD